MERHRGEPQPYSPRVLLVALANRRSNAVFASLLRNLEGRSRRLSRLALLFGAVVACSTGFSDGGLTKMTASVRPCQIVRSNRSTQEARRGSFVFVVRDTSRTRFFSFAGHGVRRATAARFVGTVRWKLHLG